MLNAISTANPFALEAYDGQYRTGSSEFDHPVADQVEVQVDRKDGHLGKLLGRWDPEGSGRRERGNRRKSPRLSRLRRESRNKRALN